MSVLNWISMPTWLAILLIAVVLLYTYLTWHFKLFESMEVPGPKPWPLVGNILPEFREFIPELDIKYAKKYGDLIGIFEGRNPTLRTSDPDMIREICIKEFNNFVNRRPMDLSSIDPILNLAITMLKGEEWKRTRNVMTPTFTSGKLRMMFPLIDKCGKQLQTVLAEAADKGDPIEMKTKFVNYMLDIIASVAFGMEINAQKNEDDAFAKYAKLLLANRNFTVFMLFFILPQWITKRLPIAVFDRSAMDFFKKAVNEIIQLRMSKSQRRNDFLQLMLDALNEAEKPDSEKQTQENTSDGTPSKVDIKKVLTSDGVIAQSLIFIIAGFDTISTTLAMTCYLLATHPEIQAKLLEEVDSVMANHDGKVTYEALPEMQYMDMVVSETLRLYPAAIRTDRQCNKDCTINDIPIPKGRIISVNIYAVHHNDKIYPDPKKFDPERFSPENRQKRHPCAYLPFGVGPRNCIGNRFALMEMKFTLALILKEFRFVCGPDTEVPIKFQKGVPGFLAENGIHLKLERRLAQN